MASRKPSKARSSDSERGNRPTKNKMASRGSSAKRVTDRPDSERKSSPKKATQQHWVLGHHAVSAVLEINPENAYGQINPQMVNEVSKTQVPEGISVGDTLQAMSPSGPINVKVLDVKEDVVILDANHPLAGQKLIFDLELISISQLIFNKSKTSSFKVGFFYNL